MVSATPERRTVNPGTIDTLFGNLLSGAKRLRVLTQRARVGVSGVSAISPGFRKDMENWLTEQRKELQLLENEVAMQIKEDQEEAATVSPVLEKNQQIRAKLSEYLQILGKQNMQLGAVKGNLLKKIAAEKREIALTNEALQQELSELRTQRSVP